MTAKSSPSELVATAVADTRAADALAALTRQAARPADVGVDRAVVRRAARILRGRQ